MKHGILIFLLFAAPFARGEQSPDQAAKFLAGLPVGEPALAARTHDEGWLAHASRLDAKWTKMERRQLVGVRMWAAESLGPVHRTTGNVFYFFSGPDFLYAHTFFPQASTYILCGTEPVGAVPDITQVAPESLSIDLEVLRRALDTMLTTHYFITKDMRVDLQRSRINGTLPILYIFLARTGCTIRGVSADANSARIEFTSPAGRKQTLHYFKTDLSNGGKNTAFFSFCRQHSPGISLIKSASYLMHGDGFSKARTFLLANSRLILQDDSGIPLRAFDPARWNVRFYGNYEGPIFLFKEHYQADLAQAYERSNPAPLGFSFGYAWQREKGLLMLASPR